MGFGVLAYEGDSGILRMPFQLNLYDFWIMMWCGQNDKATQIRDLHISSDMTLTLTENGLCNRQLKTVSNTRFLKRSSHTKVSICNTTPFTAHPRYNWEEFTFNDNIININLSNIWFYEAGMEVLDIQVVFAYRLLGGPFFDSIKRNVKFTEGITTLVFIDDDISPADDCIHQNKELDHRFVVNG
jgi:hypothetical protein